jgi:hypothetical protein
MYNMLIDQTKPYYCTLEYKISPATIERAYENTPDANADGYVDHLREKMGKWTSFASYYFSSHKDAEEYYKQQYPKVWEQEKVRVIVWPNPQEIEEEDTAEDISKSYEIQPLSYIEHSALNFTAYEFAVPSEVYLEEIEGNHTFFRLQVNCEGGMHIYSTNTQDYSVHEHVTDYFKVEEVLAKCKAAVEDDSIANVANDYFQYLIDESEIEY